jgi:hypothetical protein
VEVELYEFRRLRVNRERTDARVATILSSRHSAAQLLPAL